MNKALFIHKWLNGVEIKITQIINERLHTTIYIEDYLLDQNGKLTIISCISHKFESQIVLINGDNK